MTDEITDQTPQGDEAAPQAAPDAPAPAGDAEYEYVDENGNPVSPPPEGLDSEEYEIVEESPAAPGKTTEAPRSPSTRKLSDRKSARPSARPAPPIKKHSRVKVYLLLGMFLSIPLLIIAILVVYYVRFVRKGGGGPRQVVIESPYEQGKALKGQTIEILKQANQLWEDGKEAEAEKLYRKCQTDFEKARLMIVNYRKERYPGPEYDYMDRTSGEMLPLLKHVNERLFQFERRQDYKQRPPAPPAPPAPPTESPAPPAETKPPADKPPETTPEPKPEAGTKATE